MLNRALDTSIHPINFCTPCQMDRSRWIPTTAVILWSIVLYRKILEIGMKTIYNGEKGAVK